jgi:hypothetical protein
MKIISLHRQPDRGLKVRSSPWWHVSARVAAALVNAALAIAFALIQTKLWNAADSTKFWLAAAVGSVGFATTSITAVRDVRKRRRTGQLQKIGDALRTAMYSISEQTKISPRRLGVALYVVERDRWPSLGLGRPRRRERLVRVFRDRSRERRGSASTVWRPGKGVIGRCVKNGKDEWLDITQEWDFYKGYTKEQWDALPDDARLGLTYEEFVRHEGRHGFVLATPVLVDHGVVGCVALDGPPGSAAKLSTAAVRGELGAAADIVGTFSLP